MKTFLGVLLTAVLTIGMASVQAASQPHGKESALLAGDRLVIGTVEAIKGNQVEVDTGEVQPRFIPLKQAQEKGFSLKEGDGLEITVNDQNLLVDFHPIGEGGHHRIVQGRIDQPLTIGHEEAVIRTDEGKEEHYAVRSQARSKVASIPIGVEAVFLVDETNEIADVTFGSKEAVDRAAKLWQKKHRSRVPIGGSKARFRRLSHRIESRSEQQRERSGRMKSGRWPKTRSPSWRKEKGSFFSLTTKRK